MLTILDFSAEWCGPCKKLSPIIEELALEYPDLDIQKIDVDANKELVDKYKIRSIPTVLFIQEDEVLEKLVGAVSKLELVEKIESLK